MRAKVAIRNLPSLSLFHSVAEEGKLSFINSARLLSGAETYFSHLFIVSKKGAVNYKSLLRTNGRMRTLISSHVLKSTYILHVEYTNENTHTSG